jgi:excinuclease ABC subunit C
LPAKEYKKQVRNIKLFFHGKKQEIIKNFEKEMKVAVKAQNYEGAAKLRNKIFALNHIRDISLIKAPTTDDDRKEGIFRIEAYDIAHLSGKNTVGAMVVVEDGELKKSDYRKFKLRRTITLSAPGQHRESRAQSNGSASAIDDTANLAEVVERRLNHAEWPLPQLIVVDGSKAQLNRMNKILAKNDLNIPVVGVVKDDKHKAREIIGDEELKHSKEREILLANAEVHRFAITYHRKLRGKIV